MGTVEGAVLKSMGPGRRAYREHERVIQLDPTPRDAGLIVGLYRYIVSALPLPARMMAHLMGFSGGRVEGLRLVEPPPLTPERANRARSSCWSSFTTARVVTTTR